MPDKELWNIFQMVDHVINQMDQTETSENSELYEKIRWALGEQEHMIITLSNCFTGIKEAHALFTKDLEAATKELDQKYNKPKDA